MNLSKHLKATIGPILLAFILLPLASCQKENIEEQYPDELTIQNVEDFVDAPQEVIDELERKERLALAENNPHSVDLPEDTDTYSCANGTLHEGSLVAYDGSWRNLPNVRVKISTYSAFSTSTTDPINYRFRSLGSTTNEPYYFRINTNILNGVTPLDKLLILRHINGSQPFTSYLQMCAADVDGNNVIDQVDADLVGDAILGQFDLFPTNQNVYISGKEIYDLREAEWTNSGTFQNVGGYHVKGPDFIAVKRGDVNGTFNF